MVGKKANLRLRHEIAPPVEQHNKRAWKASFRVVQEPVNAGKGEDNPLELCFFLGEESKWEMCDRSNVNGRMMIQKDNYGSQSASLKTKRINWSTLKPPT